MHGPYTKVGNQKLAWVQEVEYIHTYTNTLEQLAGVKNKQSTNQ